jgi:hypothetical protein
VPSRMGLSRAGARVGRVAQLLTAMFALNDEAAGRILVDGCVR